MKTMKLLSPRWKRIGLLLALPGIVLGSLNFEIPWLEIPLREGDGIFSSNSNNLTNEFCLTFVIVGLLLAAYSRERIEDEHVRLMRLEAFQWSMLANFVIVLIANWAVYGFDFLTVMVLNLFTPLVVFLLRFHYTLYRNRIAAAKETEGAL